MLTVLIDSGVLIEVSRGRDKSILSKWTDLSRSDSADAVFPLLMWLNSGRERVRLNMTGWKRFSMCSRALQPTLLSGGVPETTCDDIDGVTVSSWAMH
jgi:hypothetical protein